MTTAPQPRPSALPAAPSSPSPPAPSSSSSSPPPPPLPSPPCQSHSPSSSPSPSPSLDSTISAIARAHRETFLYAHDKLANPHEPPQQLQQNNHAHQNKDAEPWGPNRCPNGYHADGLNTIYHHNNNLLPDNSRSGTHHNHSNGRRSLHNSNLIGGDSLGDHVTPGQNGLTKKHTGIVLVRTKDPPLLVTVFAGMKSHGS